MLTFTGGTDGTWRQAQRVTVTGVDDEIDNPGNARSVIITHSPDGIPDDLDPPADQSAGWRLVVTVSDDTTRKGLVVDNDPGTDGIQTGQITVTEKAGSSHTATFSVKLRSQPESGNVTVAISKH